jgi:hypothetical protein
MDALRKLADILAANVAGYSRLTGLDEEGTHAQLQGHLLGAASARSRGEFLSVRSASRRAFVRLAIWRTPLS